MSGLTRVYEAICRLEEVVAQICMVASVTVVFLAAVGRTAGYPVAWAMDLATFLFAWATFFAIDIALRHDRHVSVEVFVNLLPAKARSAVALLNHLIILGFLALLFWYGASMAYLTRYRTFQGIPGFSYAWVTLSVPVGCLLTAFTAARKCWRLGRELFGHFKGPGAGKDVKA